MNHSINHTVIVQALMHCFNSPEPLELLVNATPLAYADHMERALRDELLSADASNVHACGDFHRLVVGKFKQDEFLRSYVKRMTRLQTVGYVLPVYAEFSRYEPDTRGYGNHRLYINVSSEWVKDFVFAFFSGYPDIEGYNLDGLQLTDELVRYCVDVTTSRPGYVAFYKGLDVFAVNHSLLISAAFNVLMQHKDGQYSDYINESWETEHSLLEFYEVAP